MDQLIRSNDWERRARWRPRTKTQRAGIGRAALFVGLRLSFIILWVGVSAHFAAAKLKTSPRRRRWSRRDGRSLAHSRILAELVLPGNLQANYEAPIYARTSGS